MIVKEILKTNIFEDFKDLKFSILAVVAYLDWVVSIRVSFPGAVGETEKVGRGMFVAAEALENENKIPGVLVNEYVAALVTQRLHLSEEHARQHAAWDEGR